jgi:phosphatidylglycerophosphate synthase
VSLWESYKKSLKPLDVEEPIDVWVHRPLAYVLARSLLPTPVSPNLVTMGSIALGLCAGYCLLRDFPGHVFYGGLFLFCSAVFDCADGQLARLRGTSSVFGRMLDGVADMVVAIAAGVGSTYIIWQRHNEPAWHGLLAVALCAATIVTTSFHSSMYDHYKNVFLRMTNPSSAEGEDYETARARYLSQRDQQSLPVRLAYRIYLFYVGSQADFARNFDPNVPKSFASMSYDPERVATYRERLLPMMRHWRRWFGFGSLTFGISASLMLGVIEYYMLYRLVLMNAVFYGFMRGGQRRASKLAFAAG